MLLYAICRSFDLIRTPLAYQRPPSISTSVAGTSQLSASQPALSGSHDSLALSATSAASSAGAGEYAELHPLQQNGAAARNGVAPRMALSDVGLETHKGGSEPCLTDIHDFV